MSGNGLIAAHYNKGDGRSGVVYIACPVIKNTGALQYGFQIYGGAAIDGESVIAAGRDSLVWLVPLHINGAAAVGDNGQVIRAKLDGYGRISLDRRWFVPNTGYSRHVLYRYGAVAILHLEVIIEGCLIGHIAAGAHRQLM